MIKVYCYSKCSTCKKAIKWLEDNKIKHEVIDIKENHPNEKTLKELHKKSGLPLKKFFNTSGMLYREMELSKKFRPIIAAMITPTKESEKTPNTRYAVVATTGRKRLE